jgi:hypothetical protein
MAKSFSNPSNQALFLLARWLFDAPTAIDLQGTQMHSPMKLLLTTSLLASIGFGSATALAQTAPAAVLSPQLMQNQKALQEAALKAQEAAKKAAAEAAEAAETERVKRALLAKKDLTPQERATLKAILSAERKKSAVEATPRTQAALLKEAQIRDALVKTTAAAQDLQNKAAAAEQNAIKLKNESEALRKPNPNLGANFTPQNVTPMLKGLDDLTKRLALIKGPEDLAGRRMEALGTEMAQLRDYMAKVDGAMEGMSLSGVETPANKEAMALYARMPEFAKGLDAEMTRVQRLVPQTKAMFDKFNQ